MISHSKAKKIFDTAPIPEGTGLARIYKLASCNKTKRLSFIRTAPTTEDGQISAAIEIQRCFRGYNTRCRLLNVVAPKTSITAVYSESKHHIERLQDVRSPTKEKSAGKSDTVQNEMDEAPVSAEEKLQAKYQAYVQVMMNQGLEADSPMIISYEDFCAHIIQDWWRRVRPYKVPSAITQPSSIVPIHSVVVQRSSEKLSIISPNLNEHDAACKIQRSWRRHIDMQVFSYYRDLINFKARGDPGMMLRCINPNEAKLLDPAAGVHIKFRLAGERFPPNIYYKIYTHRPIQDLCANSPKDYTRASTKRKMAQDVHNKGSRCPTEDDRERWYKRLDNNGWRLVSDRLITHLMADPVTWESSKKKVEFHHNKLHRRQEVEKKRKRKKISWMKKMYREGMMKSRVDDPETIELIDGAAAGMIATVEHEGTDAVQEWEVDELLEWTTSLNYDDYVDVWKNIATSSKSEKLAETRSQIFSAVDSDPFTLKMSESISKINTRRDDPLPSNVNTPTSDIRFPH
ncbi:protein MFI-like [Tubulanus polymorphus]|uniref:protein MFI-like n=1 Tax=Tubulanus polymorphus TaxID=672921 RepID=UPI003DA2BBCA